MRPLHVRSGRGAPALHDLDLRRERVVGALQRLQQQLVLVRVGVVALAAVERRLAPAVCRADEEDQEQDDDAPRDCEQHRVRPVGQGTPAVQDDAEDDQGREEQERARDAGSPHCPARERPKPRRGGRALVVRAAALEAQDAAGLESLRMEATRSS